jgi:glycerol-3-phosphate dehydrogenase
MPLPQKLQTEILVIGGGATGTGILRDLAMRGFSAILVEKGDLTHGTTGRYHGLLHSGGRYVVRDPQAAIECIEENRILRRIMPHCIEDTGGFFVLTPWDDPEYASKFVAGCQKAGIPVEEVPIQQMLREEPLLNPHISVCYRVTDGSADSFLAADSNTECARQYGARVLNYHKVTSLLRQGDRIVGAVCKDLSTGEEVEISADLVVNASGAWAGQIAATVGIKVHVIPGKGTMLAMNHRIVNTVINRCKFPSDGDILVPAHTVCVIGTTDIKVTDPDHFAIEPWEVHLMLEEGDKIVPGFKQMRMLRAWAGVRPLYQETEVSDTRDVTRAFILLDHAQRDGLEGLVTITSGKWTTYRKMAEVTVDLVCKKLGTQRPCRTHLEEIPNPRGKTLAHTHHLGGRLAQIEEEASYGQLICECELATYQDVVNAINAGAKAIDDVRRDVRLGMGPCQGGFCTYRVAGILHHLRQTPVQETNVALRDFLQERWKGLLPILWGQQLRQERLDELIYLSLLNADHLPGPTDSPLSSELYEPGTKIDSTLESPFSSNRPNSELPGATIREDSDSTLPPSANSNKQLLDSLVIGMGLSGLAAAWQVSACGLKTRLIAKGQGALYWHSGCIDILGYFPIDNPQPVNSPAQFIVQLIQQQPDHPYAYLGLEEINEALTSFQDLCKLHGYPLCGSLERNWRLPTALGTIRPTCLAPETMIEGDLQQNTPMLIIGFEGFVDFYPELIAANLNLQDIPATGIALKLASLQTRRFITGRVLAKLFETADFRTEVSTAIKAFLSSSNSKAARIGFPAVLGIQRTMEIFADLRAKLGLPIFEIPTLPPSIPGMRLSHLLIDAIQKTGGQVYDGMQAVSATAEEKGLINIIWSEAAARQKPNRARNYILATGGILGGGTIASYEGWVQDTVCGLPIHALGDRNSWLNRKFLTGRGHPIFQAGIQVDSNFRPVDSQGKPFFENLYAIGTALAGADYLRQRSFEGVALATGYHIGKFLSNKSGLTNQ